MKALESCYLLFPLGFQCTNLKQRFEHTHLLMNSPTKRSLLQQHEYVCVPVWFSNVRLIEDRSLKAHRGTQCLHPEDWCWPVRKLSGMQGSRGGLWFWWVQLQPLSMVHRGPHSNIEKPHNIRSERGTQGDAREWQKGHKTGGHVEES